MCLLHEMRAVGDSVACCRHGSGRMLLELAEDQATGDIRQIYQEIRETTGVPYVSSLQRHLATRDNWLQWGWSIVGPGFRSGDIPRAVWHVAAQLDVPALPRLSVDALRALGVDAQGEKQIHNVLDSFIRVSPTNLGFSGIARRVLLEDLDGTVNPELDAEIEAAPEQVLHALQPLPSLVDIDELDQHQQGVLMQMSTTVDGADFIPGLYRMLAHWPAWFAHAVTILTPARTQAEAACSQLASRIDAVVPSLMQDLAITPPPLTDGESERRRVVDAIDRYRETSPQMVVYCRMLKAALPVQN